MNRKVKQIVYPVLAALIWGTAFVFQRESTEFVGAFTFNAARSVVAVLALSAVVFISGRFHGDAPHENNRRESRRELLKGGICCGIVLSFAMNLQQFGLEDCSAGKAGFITALYIVIVPVMGLFVNRKASVSVWVSVLIAVFGLYFLCVKDGFALAKGDIFMFLCAAFFALHIIVVDHFSAKVDGIKLSCLQFLVAGIITAVLAFVFESPKISAIWQCIGQVLFLGIMSSGVAYTLQILAQKDSNPTVISLLFSLESVFSAIAGAVILNEVMTGREFTGCVLMFSAVILSQIPFPEKERISGNVDRKLGRDGNKRV